MTLLLIAPLVLALQDSITDAEFRKLHRDLQPPEGELWTSLPWKTSLVAGCLQAAKEKKPLFMVVRSGHPLGCV